VHRFIAPALAVSLLTTWTLPADATGIYDYTKSPRQVGLVDTPGAAKDVATLGDHAYVADNTDLLQVLDLGDPSAPNIVATVALNGAGTQITVEAGFAYVVTSNGLQVLDLTNPALPAVVGTVALTAAASDLVASGTNVYAALGSSGMDVVDCSVPSSPIVATTVTDPTGSLAVEGSRLASTSGYDARLYDISSPLAPALLGTATTHWVPAWELGQQRYWTAPIISGDVVLVLDNWEECDLTTYFCVRWSTLRAFDFSVPGAPVEVGSLALDEQATHMMKSGSTAYVLSENDLEVVNSEIWIVDITDPSSLTASHRLRTHRTDGGSAAAITSSGPVILTCAAANGVRVFDVAHPEEPHWVGDDVDFTTSYEAVFHGNNVFYVSKYYDCCRFLFPSLYSSMWSYNISNPEARTLIGSLYGDGTTWSQLAIAGSKAFVRDTPSPWRADIMSNGYPQQQVTASTITGAVKDMVSVGDYLLIARGATGLSIFDATAPGDPVPVVDVTTNPASQLAVDGTAGVTLDAFTLRTLDLSTPSLPSFVGSATTTVSSWVAIDGTMAVAGGGASIEILDISNLAAPTVVSSVSFLDNVMAADIDNGIVYVSLQQGGLAAVDATDPFSPQIAGVLATDAAAGVTVHGGYVWVCEGGDVTPLPLMGPLAGLGSPTVGAVSGAALSVAPNPFRESTSIRYAAPSGAPFHLRLYDVQGRLIRRLDATSRSGAVSWDGRDEKGVSVTPGVYFLRLDSATGVQSSKVVRLR